MEKWEIRPPLPQKLPNRSSPKFAWVITSWIPTPMQNFIKISLPPFASQIRENARRVTRLVFLVLLSAYSQDPYQWRLYISVTVCSLKVRANPDTWDGYEPLPPEPLEEPGEDRPASAKRADSKLKGHWNLRLSSFQKLLFIKTFEEEKVSEVTLIVVSEGFVVNSAVCVYVISLVRTL